MKAKSILRLALAGLVAVGTGNIIGAPMMDFSRLPLAVQRTINQYLADGQLKYIMPESYNGTVVYDVYIQRPGPNRELHITPGGMVLENDPNFLLSASPLQTKRLQLTDLPIGVQTAIRNEVGTTPIDDIDQETFDGHTVYSVEFQRDGQNHEIQVASDGTLFRGDNTYALGGVSSQTVTGSAAIASRRVTISELPTAARLTAEREAAGAPIEEIDQITKNGRSFYEVTFRRNGQNVNVDIAPDGSFTDVNGYSLLSPGPGPLDQVVTGRRVTLTQTPVTVQNNIRREVGTGQINSITERAGPGRTVYHVSYDASGQRHDLLLGSDGTILRSASAPIVSFNPSPNSGIILRDARKVTFVELPAAVRDTVRTQTGAMPLEEIDQGLWNGRPAYQVIFNRNGQPTALAIANDGSILSGPVPATISAVTLPPVEMRRVAFNELPSAVQNTIRTEAGLAPIEEIRQGTVNGRTVYQTAFTKNGKHTDLRVAEDGSIVGSIVTEITPVQP